MMGDALRDVFIETLLDLAADNTSIVAIDCDVKRHTKMEKFFARFPERFYELGICEQNAVSFASGIAACGRIPVVSSFASFLTTKAWEQIRISAVYNNACIKLYATHSGLSAGEDGASHQCFEDFALMLALSSVEVFAPAFKEECKLMTEYIIKRNSTCYIRVGRDSIVEQICLPLDFKIGDPLILSNHQSARVALISTGEITHEAILASRIMNTAGIPVRLLHIGSLRPLNVEMVRQTLLGIRAVFTVEEHTKHGGLYTLMLESLSTLRIDIIPFCISEMFGQTGTVQELRKYFKLSGEDIAERIVEFCKNKGIVL